MQSIAIFTTCEKSVGLCPAVRHGFVACASITRDDMIPYPHSPRMNTRAYISPVPVPGQCVRVSTAYIMCVSCICVCASVHVHGRVFVHV